MATMRLISVTLIVVVVVALYFYQSPCLGLSTDGVLLLSFKYSILSDPLHVLDTWDFLDETPCLWQGVLCSDPDSRVIGLSLPGSGLLGSLPENLGMLNGLQTLNLSSNSINGSIPASLFTLPELRELDLSENMISGEVPDVLGGLRNLEVINLSENALAGSIPRSLAGLENLTEVNLRGNYFSGSIPGGINRVRVFDVSSNLINGSLPPDFGGGSIEYLNVSYNSISGEIPPEFARGLPENATLDFSYNNFTGEIPDVSVFSGQEKSSFAGNSDLCGPPSGNPCTIPSSPTSLPAASDDQPISPPAFAAIPRSTFFSPKGAPAGENPPKSKNSNGGGLRPYKIAAIVVGDLAGIAVLGMIFLYIYRRKTGAGAGAALKKQTVPARTAPPSSSSSSSETKGIAKWSCMRKGKHDDDEEEDEEISSEDDDEEEQKQGAHHHHDNHQQGQLVTVDNGGGEGELEVETLLKAAAYILGSSGATIMYKAVLEDGAVLAVRRVGDCGGAEKLKEFEGHVRTIARVSNHPNMVRVRGFYWSSDEKLVIYEYVPNGSLANARQRKGGSSPRHIPWEIRLKIAKGIARGLNHIHEKKHVHGNVKPSNVLLGLDFEPKIGDFGLERLTTGGKPTFVPGGSTRHFGSKRSTASRDSFQQDHHSAGPTPSPSPSSVGSCMSPYHPPESLRSLKPGPKWDVYSFGVILLELLTGKVVVSDGELGPPVLAGLAAGPEDGTRVIRMADPVIRGDLEGKEEALFGCLKLGYNCVSHVAQKRPSMKEALQILEKIPTSNCSNPSSSSFHYYGP